MKNIKFLAAVLIACGISACADNSVKTVSGVISDAAMNYVTVKPTTDAAYYTFSTLNADMTQANGLLLGAPVTVEYKGAFKTGMPAIKVSTDPTYMEAVGTWTMPDPINPEEVIGVEIEVKGVAQSINMATLRYTGWELQGEAGKILLKGVSEGSGKAAEFTQIGTISKNDAGEYTLAIADSDVIYTKVEIDF